MDFYYSATSIFPAATSPSASSPAASPAATRRSWRLGRRKEHPIGFFHGSFFSLALGFTFLAWIISSEPQSDPERIWHYVVFGAGFLFLTIYLVSQLFDQDTASAFGSIQVGIALALAAWFLDDTPYRVLTQVTWGYAAAFLVVPPAINWLMDRRRGSMDGRSFPNTSAATTAPARKPFTFSVLGDFILIAAAVVGFFMGLAFLTRVWGLLAAAAGFVLWPLTILALPWYAGFAHQEWWPLAVVYGGGVVGWLLSRSGEKKTVTTDD